MNTVTLLSFFGGVMLLLYGMRQAGDGLQKAAGARLRSFLLTATDNRFKGVGVGAAVTALFQSSSATTVMLVGFVGSGLMGYTETMGVILGADIGTTLTVQIIALKVYDYAIGIIGVGALLRFAGRSSKVKDTGQVVLGFGFVFFALKILIETFAPVTDNPLVREFILGMSADPLAGLIVSAIITALLHSSAATLGIAITAAHSGLLTLDAAMPIVLGANIGTCVSALVSSIGASVDSKRVALAHVLFKVAGVVIVFPLLGVFTDIVGWSTSDMARQVANAHTFFNIALAVVFLPFTTPFTRLVRLILPESADEKGFAPKYLDPIVLSSPSLALAQATRECLRMADIVEDMLKRSIIVLDTNNMRLLEKIEETDNDIDLLDREIKLYLTKLSREGLSGEQAGREMEIMLYSDNLENIGDVIDKNLMELARKKINGAMSFSSEGFRDIHALHARVIENFEMGAAAFAGSDVDLSRRLINHKEKFSEMERGMRQAHLLRLRRGLKESIDTSAIHLDVLTNLKRINSYVTNVAYQILEKEKGG